MNKNKDWTGERVSKAKETHPQVTDGAAARIETLLSSQLGERQLRRTELTKIANELIADMVEPGHAKNAGKP